MSTVKSLWQNFLSFFRSLFFPSLFFHFFGKNLVHGSPPNFDSLIMRIKWINYAPFPLKSWKNLWFSYYFWWSKGYLIRFLETNSYRNPVNFQKKKNFSNPFHAIGAFRYPLKTPDNQRFSDGFTEYGKRLLK